MEDALNDQIIMMRCLRKRMPIGFDLISVKTGKEGLEKTEKDKFDLLLLDYRLPDMTGLELLETLQKRHLQIPIIFVTSKGNEKIAVEAMKLGVRDYLVKDEIDSNRLVENIRNIIVESALPPEVNPEVAKHIAELFSTSTTLKIEILNILETYPKSKIPFLELISTLKELAETNFLEAKPSHSVVACPSCGSLTANPSLQCPDCGSVLLDKGEALEHLSCGYVDFRTKFDKGDSVCPKCKKKLKILGVDYRRVESWYKCLNGHFFGRPILSFACSECGEKFTLDEAALKTLYYYRLTKRGRQRLRLGLLENILVEKDNQPDHEINTERIKLILKTRMDTRR